MISESRVIGSELQYPTGQEPFGHAAGGSTTTLQDTSKSWVGDCWAGYRFRIEAGTGLGAGLITVIRNTKDTLTFSAQSFTPDARLGTTSRIPTAYRPQQRLATRQSPRQRAKSGAPISLLGAG